MKNETIEMTNPVINTAKMTLSYLAKAGVKDAVEFAEKLGLTDFRKEFVEFSKTDDTNAISQEFRYEFLNRNIKKAGRKNIMDVACGFSPRGLMMAKNGYNYRGLDLAVSVAALSKVAEESKKDNLPGKFSYSVCDITNESSLIENAGKFDGEITIVCEGLFMYLKDFEIDSFCEGLKKVLQKHGGEFYTPDFASLEFYFAIMAAFYGNEKAMEILCKMGAELKAKSDTDYPSLTSKDREPERIPFFKKHGLKVELIPFYEESENGEDLNCFKLCSDEIKNALKKSLSAIKVWKVTYDKTLDILIPEAGAANTGKNFAASYNFSGTTLEIDLSGRIDSVTAADFVEMFEKAKSEGEIKTISVNAKNLTYISSAGLRVLMMMKKHIGDSPLVVENADDLVKEIFTQTGFDNILEIK